MFLNQLTGNASVIIYSNSIFQRINENGGNLDPALGSIIIGSLNFFGALIAIFPVSYFGRKTLLIIGNLAMSISLFALGIF